MHVRHHHRRQRARAVHAELKVYFGSLQLLVAAVRHCRTALLSNCFRGWHELGLLKMELYKKVSQKAPRKLGIFSEVEAVIWG